MEVPGPTRADTTIALQCHQILEEKLNQEGGNGQYGRRKSNWTYPVDNLWYCHSRCLWCGGVGYVFVGLSDNLKKDSCDLRITLGSSTESLSKGGYQSANKPRRWPLYQ